MSRKHGLALLLVVVSAAIYAPLARFDFVHYDDPEFVYGQPQYRRGIGADTLRFALTDTSGYYWHPVTSVVHTLTFAAVGPDPGRQHLVNVAIFLATVVSLFYVLNGATNAPVAAFLAAALWAWHPLRVETVAWLTERGGLLCGFFTVLTLGAYLAYARRPGVGRYVLAATCFVLAMLSKPTVPLLPLALLLIDVWPLDRMRRAWEGAGRKGVRALALEKLPLLVLAFAISLVTWRLASVRIRSDVPPPRPAIDYLLAVPAGYGWCLLKTVLPVDLAVLYPWSNAWPRAGGAVAAIALVGITWWVIRKRTAPLIAGCLWFILMLLPMLAGAKLRSSWVADRYAFVPHVLLLAGVVAAVASRRLAVRALAVVAFVFAIVSALQVQHWRDSESLFLHALDVTDRNQVIHNNLGTALVEQRRHAEAIEHYRSAIAIQPRYADAHMNLGVALAAIGDLAGAEREIRAALGLKPDQPVSRFNLGHVLASQGRLKEAVEQYQHAVKLKPDYLDAHVNLGAALEQLGDHAGAARHYEAALKIDPNDPDARANLESLRAGRTPATGAAP